MLYRVNMLGCVYLVDRDKDALARLDRELVAVCSFPDWNPSHFLDVAEMSLAVALALDWTAGDLPVSTIEMAKQALIEKGLGPYPPGRKRGPFYSNNNWNQVCNGGLIAAAIVVAEDAPELAAQTLHRALDGLPHVLKEYAPDGVYPEGSTYWMYGTAYSVVAAAMLESAFGHDFGHLDVPGFKESARFRVLCNAPSGWYYNFADCGDRRSSNGDVILAWFAAKTGDATFFERDRFLKAPSRMAKLHRLAGASMAWLIECEGAVAQSLPVAWKGEGENPIVIFAGGRDDRHQYYFGGKGGKATTNHGNMDAGSFVFELNGVRWVVDPGNQSYHALEKTGFNLWSRGQDSQRWTLLNKSNFGHSTITVNGERFINTGFAPLVAFKGGERPQATFDMAAVYGDNIKSARRRFVKDSLSSLAVEDTIEVSESTTMLRWQLMTVAEVDLVDGGAVLRQDGELLHVVNESHPQVAFTVTPLDPPPLKLDRRIKGLKRLDLELPPDLAVNGKLKIRVRLTERR
jgi:hypothetical protein